MQKSKDLLNAYLASLKKKQYITVFKRDKNSTHERT